MYFYHIGNHFPTCKAVINTICSLTLSITYISTVISCTISAFLCYAFTDFFY